MARLRHLLERDLIDVLGLRGIAAHRRISAQQLVDLGPRLCLGKRILGACDHGHALGGRPMRMVKHAVKCLTVRIGDRRLGIGAARAGERDARTRGVDAHANDRAGGKRNDSRLNDRMDLGKRNGCRIGGSRENKAGPNRKPGGQGTMCALRLLHTRLLRLLMHNRKSTRRGKPNVPSMRSRRNVDVWSKETKGPKQRIEFVLSAFTVATVRAIMR